MNRKVLEKRPFQKPPNNQNLQQSISGRTPTPMYIFIILNKQNKLNTERLKPFTVFSSFSFTAELHFGEKGGG